MAYDYTDVEKAKEVLIGARVLTDSTYTLTIVVTKKALPAFKKAIEGMRGVKHLNLRVETKEDRKWRTNYEVTPITKRRTNSASNIQDESPGRKHRRAKSV